MTQMMIKVLVDLAFGLMEVGAFQSRSDIGPKNPDGKGFRLKLHETNPDAPLSPFYLNLRTPDNGGPLTPQLVDAIGLEFYCHAAKLRLQYDCVVGVPNAGNPFAEAYAEIYSEASSFDLPVLMMVKEEGEAGRRVAGIISGNYQPGQAALVLDDLVTEGHSKIETIKVLEKAGLIVRDIMVLVDREQGGVVQLEQAGYRVHVIYRIRELLALYVDTERITQTMREECLQYLGL